jgi:y4mF family transcriptional regulator
MPLKLIHSARQLGTIIKRVRKSNQITQKDLAAASGTGVRFIQELEKGKPTCELNKSLTVAAMLGIRIEAKLPQILNVKDKDNARS